MLSTCQVFLIIDSNPLRLLARLRYHTCSPTW